MDERIVSWCYHCGHKSSFKKYGTCTQQLNPYDKDFHALTFVESKYQWGETISEEEVIRYPKEMQEESVEVDYILQKEWTLMQCLTCLQPTLIEDETFDSKLRFEPFDEDLQQEWEDDQVETSIHFKKPQPYTLYPVIKLEGPMPEPHDKMPPEVAKIYNEARMIFEQSPRASAALLRLGLELLFKHFEFSEGDLFEIIGRLEQTKKLKERTIEACDAIRVVGNHGVHIGTINLDENRQHAEILFRLLNYIVDYNEDFLAAKEGYGLLSEGELKAIKDRPEILLKRQLKRQKNSRKKQNNS